MVYYPLVSIVIPLYNSKDDIWGCLESIRNQIYKNYEIVIVDDGSTDNSVIIVEEYIREHSDMRILLLRQENSGPSKARNNGIANSKGEIIAFIDSDDEWKTNKLSSIVSLFNNNEITLASSLYSIGENEIFTNLDNSIEVITLNKLLRKNYFITSGTVCRSNVFSEFMFNESQKYSEDYRLWLEICSNNYKCVLLRSCLVKMNSKPIYGGSGLSSKLFEMEKGELCNYRHLFKLKYINLFQFFYAVILSLLKYVIRVINVRLKK